MKSFLALWIMLTLSLAMIACDDGSNGSSDADADTDSDTDSDGDSDSDTDSDGDSDADTDSDGDTDSDSDTDTNSDTDTVESTDPDNLYMVPQGAVVYGTETSVSLDTDLDTSGLDMTLGGLAPNVPEPTYNCLDSRVTQDCLSISVIWYGEHREFVCVGEDGAWVTNISGPMDSGWGIECSPYETPAVMGFSIHVEPWSNVPEVIDAEIAPGVNPVQAHISFDWPEGGGGHSAMIGFIQGKVAGWVVHTNDLGDPRDSMFMWNFAAGWTEGDVNNPQENDSFFVRGNVKGYDIY